MIRRLLVLTALVAAMVVRAPDAIAGISYQYVSAPTTVQRAIGISEVLYADGDGEDVILIRDDSFADSLAAGAMAGSARMPVLLTPSDALPAAVLGEMSRLATTDVHIIGGTAAVSQAVEDDLAARGFAVSRLAGPNRIATAAAVAGFGVFHFPPLQAVYLARAFDDGSDPTRAFADSLGAGMTAAAEQEPLLVTATDELSPEVRTFLRDNPLATNRVHIVGGTSAVSQAVEDELVAMGFDVIREAGADRFVTAVTLADTAWRVLTDAGLTGRVVLVDGRDATSWATAFPAAATQDGGAVLLADGDVLPPITRGWLEDNGPAPLLCSGDVAEATCIDANNLLNGP